MYLPSRASARGGRVGRGELGREVEQGALLLGEELAGWP